MALFIDRLDHLVVTASDVEETVAWYERALGMRRETFGDGQRLMLRWGNQKMNVRGLNETQESWFTGRTVATGCHDLCFITEAEPDDVVAHLTAEGVEIEVGPSIRPGALGSIRSVYCRDPDGNLIEISSYPSSQ